MDNSLQIDNVQSFFKVIGNKNSLSKFLGRDVIHFVRGRAKVNAVNYENSEILIYYSSHTINGSAFFRYDKKTFIKEFGEICPPFYIEEIIEFGELEPLLPYEKIIELIQAGQGERREAEIKEIERQEAERWKGERRTLLKSLKDQFEQNFLKAANFYQTNCSRHISTKRFSGSVASYCRKALSAS